MAEAAFTLISAPVATYYHSCQPSRSARESPADQALSRVPPDREILQWIVPMAAFQSRELLHTDTCQVARVLSQRLS